MFQKAKTTNRLTALLLSLVMLLSLIPAVSLTASAGTPVTFGKVTSADDIKAENIGECTFDDAKAWVLDNWDDIIADAGDVFAVEFAYTVKGNLRTIGFQPNITKDDFQDDITDVGFDIDLLLLDYTLGGFPIYLCGFEPAASTVSFGKVTSADQITAENIEVCTFDDAKAWALDNWDDAHNSENYVVLAYSDGTNICAVYIDSGMTKEQFDQITTSTHTTTIADLKTFFSSYSADIYLCGFEPAASTVSFGKVTSADDITAENISECTFADAKAWVLDNWDDIKNDATYVDIAYSDGTDIYAVYIPPNMAKEQFTATSTGTTTIEKLKSFFNDNEDVYLCGFEAAAVTEYPLYVGGVMVTSKNTSGEGWSYAADTNTLTLNGATITGYGKDNFKRASIYYEGEAPFVIDVEGVNVVGKDDDDTLYSGIASTSDKAPLLTIQGNGTLEVKGYDNGIKNEQGNIFLIGGTINATGGSAGVTAGYNNAVAISGGDITATSSRSGAGILLYGDDSAVTITNGTVKASSVSQYGYNAGIKAGTVSISGGTVEASAISNYEYKQEIYGIQAYDVTAITGGDVTASGETRAILGTVKNGIAGTGWTNKAGTEGQAAIATSTTGQNLSTYKKVHFTPHTHDFNYSVNGATITATCAEGCPAGYDNANKPTLTIVAPELNVYGGTGSEKATLDGLDAFNAATGKTIAATNIKYYKATKDGTTYTKTGDALAAAPTNAGDYVAEIMLPVSTAKIAGTPIRVGYTIAKANITPTVSLKGWTYGTVANTPVVSGNTENGAVTYTYAVYGSDSFSATVPTDAGEYTVKATIAATANYNGGEATDDFKIYKADINPTVTLEGWAYGDTPNTPVVTGNLGNGEVTFGYAKQGIKGSLYSETVPTEVGNYVVLATIAETANYKGGEATADFTIAKADATSATVTANKLTCDGKE